MAMANDFTVLPGKQQGKDQKQAAWNDPAMSMQRDNAGMYQVCTPAVLYAHGQTDKCF